MSTPASRVCGDTPRPGVCGDTPRPGASGAPEARSTAASVAGHEQSAASDGPSCTPNIGPAERRKRLVMGVAGSSVCTLATVLLILDGAPRPWRLILALPWWTACLGIFQARAQVCVALAARGVQNLDGRQVAQPATELGAVRREARRVHWRSLAAALLLTLISIAWP